MSDTAHALHAPAAGSRLHRLIAAVSLALLAAAAVVALALSSDDSSSATPFTRGAPAVRVDGGPDENLTAAATGHRAESRPDEGAIAAAVSGR